MFSNDPYVHELYQMLLGDNVHWQDREAWIYSKNVYTRYPFQGALYGLPPDVIKECIVGAIEARFGAVRASTKPAPHGNGHANGNGHSDATATPRERPCATDRRTATSRTAAPTASLESTAPLASTAARRNGRRPAAELRGVHLQGLGRRHREALRHPVQPQALGGAADGDGDVAGSAAACRCRTSRR